MLKLIIDAVFKAIIIIINQILKRDYGKDKLLFKYFWLKWKVIL